MICCSPNADRWSKHNKALWSCIAGDKQRLADSPADTGMISRAQFQALLERCGSLIIDGALASELENRGHDLNHALWSAKLLEEDPTAITQVHLDYFVAGANIAITASYQASTKGFEEHFGMSDEKATDLIERSASLAIQAREESYNKGVPRDRPLLIAGSIGPYGAYLADGSEYRGDYSLTRSAFKDFHRSRIQALIDAHVDLLALETMPQYEEIQAVLELLRDEFPTATAWLSCTLKDSRHISDGTPVEDLVRLIADHKDTIVAFGFNCIPSELSVDALQSLGSLTDLPMVIYPNSGEQWNAETKTWSNTDQGGFKLDEQVQAWTESGAKLIGGCCRTGPDFVRSVSKILRP